MSNSFTHLFIESIALITYIIIGNITKNKLGKLVDNVTKIEDFENLAIFKIHFKEGIEKP